MERFLFKWARLGIFHSHQPENRVREVFICKIAFLLSAGLVSQTVCPSLESKVNKKWWESASHAHTPLKHEAVVCGKYFSDLFKLHPTVSGISQGLEVIRFNPFYRLPSNLVPPELELLSSLHPDPGIKSVQKPMHLIFLSTPSQILFSFTTVWNLQPCRISTCCPLQKPNVNLRRIWLCSPLRSPCWI